MRQSGCPAHHPPAAAAAPVPPPPGAAARPAGAPAPPSRGCRGASKEGHWLQSHMPKWRRTSNCPEAAPLLKAGMRRVTGGAAEEQSARPQLLRDAPGCCHYRPPHCCRSSGSGSGRRTLRGQAPVCSESRRPPSRTAARPNTAAKGRPRNPEQTDRQQAREAGVGSCGRC